MYDKDATIRSVKDINSYLEKDHLCCPPYASVNGAWIKEAYEIIHSNKPESLKYHATAEIIHPWRRAYQTTHYYHRLSIFRPFSYLLDVTTMAFLEGNWLCSYLSLLPVVEGVLTNWSQEIEKALPQNTGRQSMGNKAHEVCIYAKSHLAEDNYFHRHLGIKADYLAQLFKDIFYANGTEYLEGKSFDDRIFNRHIPSHMLHVPKHIDSGINTASLFLMLDLMAELYLYTNYDRYNHLSVCFMDEVLDKEEMDNYWDLYLKCSILATEGSYLNRLHNICYKNKKVA